MPGASAIGWALADRVFNVRYDGDPWIFVYGIVGGAVAVTLAGWLGTRAPRDDARRAGLSYRRPHGWCQQDSGPGR